MINNYYNKLTKPIRDSKLTSILDSIDTKDLFPSDTDFNFKERLSIKNDLISSFIPWVKDFLTGLEKFNHKYVVNGNSDALNMIFMERNFKRVCFLKNEYSYYSHLCKVLSIDYVEMEVSDLDQLTNTDLFLISLPSSYNGTSSERIVIIDKLQQMDIRIFVDVAYCGLTEPFYLNLKTTENTYLAFTFSKTASLSFNRIAILFSNVEIPGVEIMNKIGYVNLAGANAAINVMKSIPVDYFYSTYSNQYLEICQRLDLQPTKCILFGHDRNNDKFCTTPYYKLLD